MVYLKRNDSDQIEWTHMPLGTISRKSQNLCHSVHWNVIYNTLYKAVFKKLIFSGSQIFQVF